MHLLKICFFTLGPNSLQSEDPAAGPCQAPIEYLGYTLANDLGFPFAAYFDAYPSFVHVDPVVCTVLFVSLMQF